MSNPTEQDKHKHLYRNGIDNLGDYIVCECGHREYATEQDNTARTLSEILEQAFTDGASDTMWQGDRHVEIFATAKAELEALIANEKRLARIDELEKTVFALGNYPPDSSYPTDISGFFVVPTTELENRIATLTAEASDKEA